MNFTVAEFIGLLAVTVFVVIWHQYWKKQNMRFIKEVGKVLEEVLQPEDQQYTWLGGVVGFSAVYTTGQYGKVKAVFTTLPRQSLLYLPVALVFGRADMLELLVPTREGIKKPELPAIEESEYLKDKKALFVRLNVKRTKVSELEIQLKLLLSQM